MTGTGTLAGLNFVKTMIAHGWDTTSIQEGWVAVGLWTGPCKQSLCLKACQSKYEAEIWLSPGAQSADAALQKAVIQYQKLKRLMPQAAQEWETAMSLRLA